LAVDRVQLGLYDAGMHDLSEIFQTGLQHHQAGRLSQAEQLYRQILQTNPGHAMALHSLGTIAHQKGNFAAAATLIAKAIAISPDVPQFYNTIAASYNAAGTFQKALSACRKAISLKPDYAKAYNNMGIALLSTGQYEQAAATLEKAVSLNPGLVEAHNNLAVALYHQNLYDRAIDVCNKALKIKPDYAEAYNTLASVFRMQGQYEEAIENYRKTIALKPDYTQAHLNLGLVLLSTGQFEEGWKQYLWRRSPELETYPHRYQIPCWDGCPITGKRLLIHYEQGFGDTIQFVRYLPMVKALGPTITVEVRRPLLELLRNFDGIDQLVEASVSTPPAGNFDFYVPLLTLPKIFGTSLDTIPADVPYIRADASKSHCWRKKPADSFFKVGLVWAATTRTLSDSLILRERSCDLQHFAPLLEIAGVKLYSLQKGPPAEQARSLLSEFCIEDLGAECEDFADTAAVIENLDLVISADTATLHLAGAMAKPVWGLLPFTADWRWLINRPDSPWYPTMTLFRQSKPGQWKDVIESVAKQLHARVQKQ